MTHFGSSPLALHRRATPYSTELLRARLELARSAIQFQRALPTATMRYWASHALFSLAPAHLRDALSTALALPFDLARAQFGQAQQAGAIEMSMLSSHSFERAIHELERLALGPLARER
jgi:hypothetical protein